MDTTPASDFPVAARVLATRNVTLCLANHRPLVLHADSTYSDPPHNLRTRFLSRSFASDFTLTLNLKFALMSDFKILKRLTKIPIELNKILIQNKQLIVLFSNPHARTTLKNAPFKGIEVVL